jgi:hypothetical protein
MSDTMHCPGCGNESTLDQKFCRQCGFNLAPVSKLIQAGSGDESQLDKVERDKLLMKHMVRWMMWGMLVMLIGIVLAVANKQLHIPPLLNLISTVVILGGVSVITYGVLDTLRGGGLKKEKPKAIAAAPKSKIEQGSSTNELDDRLPIPIASVTERTTQLIGVERDRSS